jgi:hypothetical protein
MPKDFVNDPNYWHRRAEETRELAKRVIDDAARKRLSEMATEFDRIGLRVEDRLNTTKEQQPPEDRRGRHIDVRPNWKEQPPRPSLTGKEWR